MKALALFLATSVVFWLVVGGAGYVLFGVLKRAGFFSRMRDDAKQSIGEAASNAVDKIVK